MLDGTLCPIERPSTEPSQKNAYSGKHKQHGIKYEVGIDPNNGFIVWVGGPTVGSMHDMRLMKLAGILQHLDPGELVLADMGYIGHDQFITPFKKPTTLFEDLLNAMISNQRWIVEHVLARFKVFKCLSEPWRHDLDLHPITFFVIAEIVNIDTHAFPVRKNYILLLIFMCFVTNYG